MKQVLICLAGFALLTTPAFAGYGDGESFGGGCDHKNKTAKVYSEPSESFVIFESNGHQLEQVAGTELFNVKTQAGQVLAQKIDKQALKAQFPHLFQAIEG